MKQFIQKLKKWAEHVAFDEPKECTFAPIPNYGCKALCFGTKFGRAEIMYLDVDQKWHFHNAPLSYIYGLGNQNETC